MIARLALVLIVFALPSMASAQELGTLQLEADDGSELRLYLHDKSTASHWREMCVLPCSLAIDARERWAIAPVGHDPVWASLHLRGAPSAAVSFQDRHRMRDDGVIVLAVFLPASVASFATLIGMYAAVPQDSQTILAEIILGGAGLLFLAVALAIGLPLSITRDIARITSAVPIG